MDNFRTGRTRSNAAKGRSGVNRKLVGSATGFRGRWRWGLLFAALAAWFISRNRSADTATPAEYVRQSCLEFGVDSRFPIAIMYTESGGKPQTRVGAAGEIGIMQVTPPAMETTGYYIDLDSSLYEQATAGVAYWTWLLQRGKGTYWAVRAYNVGPTGADRGNGYSYLLRVISNIV